VALEAVGGLVGELDPWSDPSKSERCVGRTLPGSVRSSTREAVVLAGDEDAPVSSSCTGWFAPWWPNFIFVVFAPAASPRSWCPRQMPNTGVPVPTISRIAVIA
jgi:hypothetical protein